MWCKDVNSLLCLCEASLAGDITFSTCPFCLLPTFVNMIFWNWVKLILMPIGTSGPQGTDMKRSTLVVRRLKVKVKWSLQSCVFDPCGSSSFSSLNIYVFDISIFAKNVYSNEFTLYTCVAVNLKLTETCPASSDASANSSFVEKWKHPVTGCFQRIYSSGIFKNTYFLKFEQYQQISEFHNFL